MKVSFTRDTTDYRMIPYGYSYGKNVEDSYVTIQQGSDTIEVQCLNIDDFIVKLSEARDKANALLVKARADHEKRLAKAAKD